jgi:hypothetical protein
VRAAAIGFGIVILFGLVFFDGLGNSFFTYSAFGSAVSVALAGALLPTSELRIAGAVLAVLAGLSWLPIVYQGLTWETAIDWGGLSFDGMYLIFLVCLFNAHVHHVPVKT